MKIHIVANETESDLGLLMTELQEFSPLVRFSFREYPSSWATEVNADLLILLGSSWSVYWKSVSKNVRAESALVHYGVTRGIPILGVCFGAQLLSHTYGGLVTGGNRAEIGWSDVVSTSANTPLGGRWMQWHYDSFTAPPGFDVLAINDCGIQAIHRGRALGVQFHPEVTEEIVRKWIAGDGAVELAKLGISPADLYAETELGVKRTAVATKSLVHWFLNEVAQEPVAAELKN